MKVFDRAPDGHRTVIVATNIAEASVTIEGVVYVIDCGFVKMKGYNAATGIECLVVRWGPGAGCRGRVYRRAAMDGPTL